MISSMCAALRGVLVPSRRIPAAFAAAARSTSITLLTYECAGVAAHHPSMTWMSSRVRHVGHAKQQRETGSGAKAEVVAAADPVDPVDAADAPPPCPPSPRGRSVSHSICGVRPFLVLHAFLVGLQMHGGRRVASEAFLRDRLLALVRDQALRFTLCTRCVICVSSCRHSIAPT